MKPQFGVCGNKVGCSLAYTGEKIPASPGTSCPECGQPLIIEKANKGGSGKLVLILGIAALLLLAVIGGTLFVFKDKISQLFSSQAQHATKIVQAPDADDAGQTNTGQANNYDQPPSANEKPQTASDLPTPPPPPTHGTQQHTVVQAPDDNPKDNSTSASIPVGSASTPTSTPVVASIEQKSPTPSVPASTLESNGQSTQNSSPSTPQSPDGGNVEKPATLSKAEVDGTRQDVLKRINAMPKFSAEEKQRLTEKMETARSMERLVVVRFAIGQTTLGKAAAEDLLKRFKSKELDEKTSDPTIVFVVAGYADSAGDPKKNLQLSEQRADAVTKILKDQTNLLNVVHSLGMGSTDLLDNQRNDQNRAVEIWAVAP
jgi:outer membrane protein OmpA-like peptidoglycan-associated protein